jgi:hypothetical protein
VFVNDYPPLKVNVFKPDFGSYSSREQFFQMVCLVNYPYFVWNGKVYKVNDDQIGYIDTQLMYKDFL